MLCFCCGGRIIFRKSADSAASKCVFLASNFSSGTGTKVILPWPKVKIVKKVVILFLHVSH